MNPAESLRDIHGLEAVSWWPLAPGWWIIVVIVVTLFLLLLGFLVYRYVTKKKKQTPNWREVALAEWTTLTTEPLTPREQLARLAILLRRIAMQRYGRQTCAGLNGEHWLTWLTEHDPRGFNWQQTEQFLLELPYMPPEISITEEQLHHFQQAVHAWIVD